MVLVKLAPVLLFPCGCALDVRKEVEAHTRKIALFLLFPLLREGRLGGRKDPDVRDPPPLFFFEVIFSLWFFFRSSGLGRVFEGTSPWTTVKRYLSA